MSEQSDQERWNTRYSGEDYLFGTSPNAFLASQRHLLGPGQRALAVADGEGRNGVWLAEHGLRVTALDFSSAALAKARRLADSRGVEVSFVQADLAAWEWQESSFDVVAAIFIQFADPTLREAIFRGIRRTLAPGGLLLLQGYRPEQIQYGTGGPPHAENMYTAAMLREVFHDFEIVSLVEHDSVIQEGTGHYGMSALVDLVARKPS
ncbi:class I SAM-dependent methyltransferase [Microvirga makkahensis]|uniref:Methyltransferase domain-containing protein n=1 Tax=Microvirga makkahensis TaxID=1128670 RepID=A0A7X3MVS6_9HYPH|nr:class I SAM-dependent methyltransferase [Microvirga makkahensis]MXQ14137.1 methyltransferase domain-containing protein [Microvirga makkahensis]